MSLCWFISGRLSWWAGPLGFAAFVLRSGVRFIVNSSVPLISIPLNIAEGAGKQTARDQAKFYDIARGSALECGPCLDVLVVMKVLNSTEIQTGKSYIIEIVSMFTALSTSEEIFPHNSISRLGVSPG